MRADEEITLGAAASPAQPVPAGAKIAGLYDLEETLGSGHFAVVKLARHVFTGVKVAVKVVDKTKLDNVSKAHLFQEVRCMKLVQHPNVVRLYEVIDTQTKLYLVLELGDGGDLYDYIMKHEGGLSENLARKYFCQILRAVAYCHQLHVVHRDLKPENVVFFEKLGLVKLTDFGFSNNFLPGQKLETFCGSLAYSAPEILLGESYDAPPVDIWSLGVILYMLVCGQPPFEKGNDSETLTMIMDCKYSIPPQISQQCQKLIALMLVREPKNRASLAEIAADIWLKENDNWDLSEYLPLVSRQELSEEDHAYITQKMINGNIATNDEILQSLDKSKYNHVTATYYLLAEIRLRKYQEDRRKQIPKKIELGNLVTKLKRDALSPANINVGSVSTCANIEKDKRSRKCSIVREEDEDEFANDSAKETNQLKVLGTRRESASDRSFNSLRQDNLNKTPISLEEPPTHISSKIVLTPLTPKLNQNEKHSEMMSSHEKKDLKPNAEKPFVQEVFMGFKNLEIKKLPSIVTDCKNPFLAHRRPKSKNWTPSCSSSEASDDDTKARSKKKNNKFVGDMPTRFQMHRRDSHDDSSDSQDHQTLPSSSSHSLTTNIIFGNKSNQSSEKKGHTKDREPNKSEGKSSHSNTQKSKKQTKSIVEKSFQKGKHFLSINCVRRKRVRVNQPLDRITEAQEFQQWNRNFVKESYIEQQNALLRNKNNNKTSVETKEKKMDLEVSSNHVNHTLNAIEASLSSDNLENFKSVDKIDLICGNEHVTKEKNLNVSNCLVAVKEIRRLRRYFPVVNFS